MIVQGSNNPIRIIFEDENDMPIDIAVTLSNELGILRHWEKPEMEINEAAKEITIPITQHESLEWEAGKCRIGIKMLDLYNNTIFASAEDYIRPWNDDTVLEG